MILTNINVILLGKNSSPPHIISSIIFVVILFFYIYTVGSYFHVEVSPLENRVNYHESFAVYVINEYFDHVIIALGIVLWLVSTIIGRAKIFGSVTYAIITIIAISAKIGVLLDIVALTSLPIAMSLLICNRFRTNKILRTTSLPLTYISIIGIVLGFVCFILSTAPLFSITEKSIPIHDYANEIFLLLANVSPILVLFLVIGSPFKLFMKNSSTLQNKNLDKSTTDSIRSMPKILCLLLIMLLSVTIGLIPHLATVNPHNQEVGSDSPDYVIWMKELTNSNDIQEVVHRAFVTPGLSDRPISLLFLFAIVKTLPTDPSYTIDHLPIILGPILVLAVFFLTREITSSDTASLLSSFLTAISFHTLIGMYSGIYANWIALIIGYLSLVFLIRFLKVPNKLNLTVFSILLILLVFAHVYTWTILALFASIFLVVMYKLNSYQKKSIIILLTVILFSVAVDAIRSNLTGFSGGIESDIGSAHASGLGQLSLIWENLTDTTQNYSGGIFGNFIIFSIAVYWFSRSNSRDISSIFILIFLAIAILPLLFGDGTIQSRMLYDIPFQIPAAIGLTYYLKKRPGGMFMILPICIWLLAMSIRAVSNFYFISPQ
jgi:hypothetical protein